jgi:hypothetical protein
MSGFERVLKRLVEDPSYSEAVSKDVSLLKKDYDISVEELVVLMQLWITGSRDARLSIWSLCHCCCSTLDL